MDCGVGDASPVWKPTKCARVCASAGNSPPSSTSTLYQAPRCYTRLTQGGLCSQDQAILALPGSILKTRELTAALRERQTRGCLGRAWGTLVTRSEPLLRVLAGSGAGDWGGLPGGRRRALASGGQARPRPLGPPSILPAHRAPGPRPGGCGFCSGGGGNGGGGGGGSGHGGRRRGRRGSRGLELPWLRSEPPLPQLPMLLLPTALLPPDPQVLLVLGRLPPPWPPDTGYRILLSIFSTWGVPSQRSLPKRSPSRLSSPTGLPAHEGGGEIVSRDCALLVHQSS